MRAVSAVVADSLVAVDRKVAPVAVRMMIGRNPAEVGVVGRKAAVVVFAAAGCKVAEVALGRTAAVVGRTVVVVVVGCKVAGVAAVGRMVVAVGCKVAAIGVVDRRVAVMVAVGRTIAAGLGRRVAEVAAVGRKVAAELGRTVAVLAMFVGRKAAVLVVFVVRKVVVLAVFVVRIEFGCRG